MTLAEVYRRDYGRILASLIRTVRDISLAEDSLQDAFAAAHVQWPTKGTPANPSAWLLVTARHKAIDQLRRRTLAEEKHQLMSIGLSSEDAGPQAEDTLRLIFTCCHPALAPETQVALTLRTVCGLSTEEIARAFLLPVATLAQRLVRAKTKIKLAGIPYSIPSEDALPERLQGALATIYLVFNEGYAASSGAALVRTDLCDEAVRLGRDLVSLLPKETEARALLALMLLTDARRATRLEADGRVAVWEAQDRRRWDASKIAEGLDLVEGALRGGPAGPYALQAAVAALHARAPSAEATDWPQIALLYKMLMRLNPSPVIALNHAVAVAMAEGPEKGLALMEGISLPHYHLLPAARADLFRRLGRREEAITAYHEALALVPTDAERRFLKFRLSEMTG